MYNQLGPIVLSIITANFGMHNLMIFANGLSTLLYLKCSFWDVVVWKVFQNK